MNAITNDIAHLPTRYAELSEVTNKLGDLRTRQRSLRNSVVTAGMGTLKEIRCESEHEYDDAGCTYQSWNRTELVLADGSILSCVALRDVFDDAFNFLEWITGDEGESGRVASRIEEDLANPDAIPEGEAYALELLAQATGIDPAELPFFIYFLEDWVYDDRDCSLVVKTNPVTTTEFETEANP